MSASSDCPSADSSSERAYGQMRPVIEVLRAAAAGVSEGQRASVATEARRSKVQRTSAAAEAAMAATEASRGVLVLDISSKGVQNSGGGGVAGMNPQLLQAGPSPSPAALQDDAAVVCDSLAAMAGATLTHSNDDASTNLLLHRQMESLRSELVAGAGSQQWEVHGELGKGAFGVVYKVGKASWARLAAGAWL